MASRWYALHYSLSLLFLLIFLQAWPSLQLVYVVPEHFRRFMPIRDDAPVVRVDINNIAKALWDSGYKIMSLIVENHLADVVPAGCEYYPCKNTLLLYNNNTITIFAPRDDSIKHGMFIKDQVVTPKVDKQSFESGALSNGSALLTFDGDEYGSQVQVTQVPTGGADASISNVKIINWDIYNDGPVAVHGVEGFFETSPIHVRTDFRRKPNTPRN